LSKVLIVDDSVSVRKALERLLAPRNFDVNSASSAEHALELIATTVPDLIIADVVMPGMTGFELCQRLKAMPSYKQIPVILISGIVDAAVQSQAKESGAQSVVSKPFTPEDLFPQIDRALAQAVTSSAAASPATVEPAPLEAGMSKAPITKIQFDTYLNPLLEKAEIESAMIVTTSTEAEVLAQAGQSVANPELIAVYVRTFISISGGLGRNLELPELHGFALEFNGKSIFAQRINDTTALVLLIGGTNIPSTVRYLVQRQMPGLQQALA
jgi:CheY-like chemotaxis protein